MDVDLKVFDLWNGLRCVELCVGWWAWELAFRDFDWFPLCSFCEMSVSTSFCRRLLSGLSRIISPWVHKYNINCSKLCMLSAKGPHVKHLSSVCTMPFVYFVHLTLRIHMLICVENVAHMWLWDVTAGAARVRIMMLQQEGVTSLTFNVWERLWILENDKANVCLFVQMFERPNFDKTRNCPLLLLWFPHITSIDRLIRCKLQRNNLQLAPFSFAELHMVACFACTIGSYLTDLGYAVSLWTRSCIEMCFPSSFNYTQFSLATLQLASVGACHMGLTCEVRKCCKINTNSETSASSRH